MINKKITEKQKTNMLIFTGIVIAILIGVLITFNQNLDDIAKHNIELRDACVQVTNIAYKQKEQITILNKKIEVLITQNERLLDKVEEKDVIPHTEKEVESRVFTSSNNTVIDISILERTAEAEVTGGTIEQKMNVVQAVLNRVSSENFPDTVEGVVFQNRQFSCISDNRYFEVVITESTKEAVQKVLSSNNNIHEALYFMNRAGSDERNIKWFDEKLTFLFNDGVHSYYKD